MAPTAGTYAPVNPFRKLGVYSILALLFVAYSRIFDFVLGSYHLPAICYVAVIASCILCGALFTAMATPIGLLMLGFTGCMLVDLPFSMWRGGSFQIVVQSWPKALLLFIAVGGLVTTVRHCRHVMMAIALATGLVAWMSLMLGNTTQGRLLMSGDSGKFSNPNDLAQALLIGLPFWLFLARNPNRTPFRRIIPLAFVALLMVVLAKTGSRGAFVALCMMLALVFWNATPAGKLGL